jgi:pimeloyl-ACP methyl ester carboxylesterase
LPSGGATNVPIAAVEHQTSGMGPSCGPTHNPVITANLALPLVGRGYAVVATDYAGMGVDNGMVSYLNGASEAAATLDAVRALRHFHDPRFDAAQLSADFFVIGHSQGGHAALFTHQYFDPTLGVSLLGSVSFAPGLGNAKDWSASFSDASKPLGLLDAFATMSLYAQRLYVGGPDAATWLTAGAQSSLPTLLHDDCANVGPRLQQTFKTQGALYTPAFLSAAASCGFTAPCAGFEPWSTELESEEPGDFASPVPALLLQGASDTVVLPADTACIAQRLTARGTPVQACEYTGLDHVSVVPNALPDALLWMAGRRVGLDLSVCTTPLWAQCTLRP